MQMNEALDLMGRKQWQRSWCFGTHLSRDVTPADMFGNELRDRMVRLAEAVANWDELGAVVNVVLVTCCSSMLVGSSWHSVTNEELMLALRDDPESAEGIICQVLAEALTIWDEESVGVER